jgi:EAL domain-containing protein (putative c-di-GMP-specific phosphodiesterase class I)
MSHYHINQPSVPLRDSGFIEFAVNSETALAILRDSIDKASLSEDVPLGLYYSDQEKLLRLISKLHKRLPEVEAQNVRCRITYDNERRVDPAQAEMLENAWFPVARLFGAVGGRSVADYILHQLFTTYLQPIVQPSGSIIGYEFLMRPLPELPPFRPAELFAAASNVGQHSFLDRAARHSAIQMASSHLQNGTKRFINFLPSSLHSEECLRSTFAMISDTETDPGDYVFEVNETEKLDDPAFAKIFDLYREQGVRLAMDDVGSGYATLGAVSLLQPDYVKMDRKWVSGCDRDTKKQRYIDDLLERVSRFNGVVLAEGVEREEEWTYLRKAGVPLLQGYLFGVAAPVPASSKERVR